MCAKFPRICIFVLVIVDEFRVTNNRPAKGAIKFVLDFYNIPKNKEQSTVISCFKQVHKMQYLKCTLKHFNGFYCLRIIFIWGQSFPFEIVLRKVDDAKFESLTLFHFCWNKEDCKFCIKRYHYIHDNNTIHKRMRY